MINLASGLSLPREEVTRRLNNVLQTRPMSRRYRRLDGFIVSRAVLDIFQKMGHRSHVRSEWRAHRRFLRDLTRAGAGGICSLPANDPLRVLYEQALSYFNIQNPYRKVVIIVPAARPYWTARASTWFSWHPSPWRWQWPLFYNYRNWHLRPAFRVNLHKHWNWHNHWMRTHHWPWHRYHVHHIPTRRPVFHNVFWRAVPKQTHHHRPAIILGHRHHHRRHTVIPPSHHPRSVPIVVAHRPARPLRKPPVYSAPRPVYTAARPVYKPPIYTAPRPAHRPSMYMGPAHRPQIYTAPRPVYRQPTTIHAGRRAW